MRRRVKDSKTTNDESTKVAELAEKIDTTKEGICIIGYDGKIVGVNKAFEKLTGYTRGELIGESPIKMHPEREKGRISAGLKKCQENHSNIGFKTILLRKDKRQILMRIEFDTYPW
jgi:PAS domain S-box-containing protein